jgi:hypothetical protein
LNTKNSLNTGQGIIHGDCSSLLSFLTDQMEIGNNGILNTKNSLNTGQGIIHGDCSSLLSFLTDQMEIGYGSI